MGHGLRIAAGILTIIATYLLVWGTYYSAILNGQGGISSIMGLLTASANYASLMAIPSWAVYIVLVCVIIVLIAGILMMVGRATSIIASILILLIAIILLLDSFGIAIPMLGRGYIDAVFAGPSEFLPGIMPSGIIPAGILPFSFAIPVIGLQVGLILLLVGGLLGLIGGISGND